MKNIFLLMFTCVVSVSSFVLSDINPVCVNNEGGKCTAIKAGAVKSPETDGKCVQTGDMDPGGYCYSGTCTCSSGTEQLDSSCLMQSPVAGTTCPTGGTYIAEAGACVWKPGDACVMTKSSIFPINDIPGSCHNETCFVS